MNVVGAGVFALASVVFAPAAVADTRAAAAVRGTDETDARAKSPVRIA